MTIPQAIPQMIPFYGFTPYPMTQQQQPTGPCQSMAMPSQPPTETKEQAGKNRRHRKRREKEDTTTMETSSVPSRKRKKTHTVWLNVGGKRIPAKYRA